MTATAIDLPVVVVELLTLPRPVGLSSMRWDGRRWRRCKATVDGRANPERYDGTRYSEGALCEPSSSRFPGDIFVQRGREAGGDGHASRKAHAGAE